MELHGSCHCKKIQFTVISETPYPFNICYCSICRKLNGVGNNIRADFETLKFESGKEYLKEYSAVKGSKNIR
jgi:hypothetical protein